MVFLKLDILGGRNCTDAADLCAVWRTQDGAPAHGKTKPPESLNTIFYDGPLTKKCSHPEQNSPEMFDFFKWVSTSIRFSGPVDDVLTTDGYGFIRICPRPAGWHAVMYMICLVRNSDREIL